MYRYDLIQQLNRPGFPGECFICELRLPDQYFRWKHNKLFLLLPEEYGPAFPAIVDCYTSPPTLVWSAHHTDTCITPTAIMQPYNIGRFLNAALITPIQQDTAFLITKKDK
ncbi:hypothetical protein HMPREF1589_00339 [Escherichia coli 113290]|nr:hypothetical protein HMPREF1589_00339 [Escherichia coli 113290]